MSLKKSTFAALLLASCVIAAPIYAEDAAPTQGLPLQQVSLFSSGVGYFGRSGIVNGKANITLFFQRDGLNDVLKSLVISDTSGQLRPVTYSLPELFSRSQTNDLPLPTNQTLGSILRAFQGAKLAITTGNKTVQGRLLSVATKNIINDEGTEISVDVASILTDAGFQTVRLDQLSHGGKVLLLDQTLSEKLSAQLQQSATTLASSVDSSYLPVTLHFAGNDKHRVNVGYIQATSVWKTSYRLVFDSAKNNSKAIHPLLQGWAVVENTTNEDWNNISLSLVAGTPVSFTMDMSSPLFVQRPDVPVPFGGTLVPQVYSESMDDSRVVNMENRLAKPPAAPRALLKASSDAYGAAGIVSGISAKQLLAQQVNTSSAQRGELFEYAIDQPISLERGEASMIPIVSQTINGEKFSIFDTRNSDLHAVNGLRITNSTNLHLAGGPLTIYENGSYAGDAQITDLAPGESRLISYSLDGDLVISSKPVPSNAYIMGFSVKNGVLIISRKQRQIKSYELHNKANADKKVLILAPIRRGYELVEPAKAAGKTKDAYQFEVSVPARKNQSFKLVSERTYSETAALLDTDIDALLVYSHNKEISPQVKTALAEVVQRRNAVSDIQHQRKALQDDVKNISEDQDRIRRNMNSIPRDSDLYKSYIAKLTAQETQLETLRRQIATLQKDEAAAKEALRDFVQNLDVT